MNTIISWKEHLHMRLIPWFLQLLPKDHPLITGLWRSEDLMFGPMITTAVGTVLGTPQNCTDSTHKEGVWRRPVCLSRGFGLWGKYVVALWKSSQGKEAVDKIIVLSLCHIPAVISQKGTTPLIGTLVFTASTEGHICMGWLLWPMRVTLAGFTELSSTESEFL